MPHNVASTGPERHAQPDFRHTLAGHVRENAIDTDAREQQGQAGEYAEQCHQEALPRERGGRKLFHGTNLIERLIAGSSTQFPPQWLDYTQWLDARPDGHRHKRGEKVHQGVRHLRELIIDRNAHLGLVVARKPPMADMAHHAYDLGRTYSLDPKTLADGLSAAESVLR